MKTKTVFVIYNYKTLERSKIYKHFKNKLKHYLLIFKCTY